MLREGSGQLVSAEADWRKSLREQTADLHLRKGCLENISFCQTNLRTSYISCTFQFHVCMHACMYTHAYVCGCMYVCMYLFICMYVCIYVFIKKYVCMYVYVLLTTNFVIWSYQGIIRIVVSMYVCVYLRIRPHSRFFKIICALFFSFTCTCTVAM